MNAKLVGHALLAAATFADGPSSGTRIEPEKAHGMVVPFRHPPVQGISGLLDGGDGTYLALLDNGYGALENSSDFLLRIYRLKLELRTPAGGSGAVQVLESIPLRDPNEKLSFPITYGYTNERLLTGADLDPESFVRAPDGSFWIGDEFGPFLLHFDVTGVLLEPPYELLDPRAPTHPLRSPQNPLEEETAGLRVMNALSQHALEHGNLNRPACAMQHQLIADGNARIDHPARGVDGPAALERASREVFALDQLHRAGYATLPWTLNDPARMVELIKKGANGLITDRPDLGLEVLKTLDLNGDGVQGDFLSPEGLIVREKLDLQGHRGARALRPENTLPSFEAALDALVTTLELDVGLSADGMAMISHDPWVEPEKCRRSEAGTAAASSSGRTTSYGESEVVLLRTFQAAALQRLFICDGVTLPDTQKSDRSLSPVSIAYAQSIKLADPYVMPSLEQLFEFVEFYTAWYQKGPGAGHAEASRRALNARSVRYNIETKRNPRSDEDLRGAQFRSRSASAEAFATALGTLIGERGLESSVAIQSFDFSTLLEVHRRFPLLQTVALLGDHPVYDGAGSGEGANLQPEEGSNPWLGGLPWPYRQTKDAPSAIPTSGGFEGLGITPDGTSLLALLEKPRTGAQERVLELYRFDLLKKRFVGAPMLYPLEPGAVGVGEFRLLDASTALAIERDDTQGNLEGIKRIYKITLTGPGERVQKELLVDLLRIPDPSGLMKPVEGDVPLPPGRYAFPYWTIEALVPVGSSRLLVVNDNNLPFSVGRHTKSQQPDDTEFILLELDGPILPGKK